MKKRKTTKAKKPKVKFRSIAMPVPTIRRYHAGKPIVKGEIY